MEVLRLSCGDVRLLSARCAEHGNSPRRMAGALREAGAAAVLDRLRLLRRMERRFAIDLGSLCHRFERCDAAASHPLERMVLGYVAAWSAGADGERELWVYVDRVREVQSLVEQGRLVGEPE